MRGLVNAMRLHAQQGARNLALVRIGTVVSYNPADYCAKVMIHPEEAVTGWLPVVSPWVGNGWGLHAPVTPGDQVDVQFVDGDFTVGYVSQRFFTDSARPLNVPSGEFWLVHASGAFVKLTNDGKLSLRDQAGSTVLLNGDGTGAMTFAGGLTVNANVQVNGNVVASGNISDLNGTKGAVQHMRDFYDVHTHGGVQTGGGSTSTPSNTL